MFKTCSPFIHSEFVIETSLQIDIHEHNRNFRYVIKFAFITQALS